MDKFIKDGLEKIDLPGKKKEVSQLNTEMSSEGFWDDKDKAAEVSQRASNLTRLIETWEGIVDEVDELTGLLSEISPEKDPKAAEEFRVENGEMMLGTWQSIFFIDLDGEGRRGEE